MSPPLSEEVLDRYLAGLCTPAESMDVERTLSTHLAAQQALGTLRAAAKVEPKGMPSIADAWPRFERRLERDDLAEAQEANLPWWGVTAQWARSVVALGVAFGVAAIAAIGFVSAITNARVTPEASTSVSLLSAVTNDMSEQPLVELTIRSPDDDWFATAVR